MKKLFKVSLGILLVGIVLMIIGFCGHGANSIGFKEGRPVIVKSVQRTLSSNKRFNQLQLTTTTADVTIKTGKQFKVTYSGESQRLPQLSLKNGILTIKQREQYGVFISNDSDDHLTITVPRGTKIGGQLTTDGDLDITGVDLQNATVKVDGDASYHHLTVNGGQTKLTSGDFTSHNVTFRNRYTIKNEDGDNQIDNSRADGFVLRTVDGNNKLDGVDHGSQEMSQNAGAQNVLYLINKDGDNTVVNVQAVQ